MKKNRKNVLRSFLFVCLGLTVATITFAGVAVIKAPSHPGKPLIVDMWRTGCLLNYLTPQNDGGEPVTNYYIEYRGQWELGWKFRGSSKTLEYRLEGMKEGSMAQFRVNASNSAGMSGRPSKSSGFIEFASPF